MDTALPQKFPFILDRNLVKVNCTENRIRTSCDILILGPSGVFYIISCGFMRNMITIFADADIANDDSYCLYIKKSGSQLWCCIQLCWIFAAIYVVLTLNLYRLAYFLYVFFEHPGPDNHNEESQKKKINKKINPSQKKGQESSQ